MHTDDVLSDGCRRAATPRVASRSLAAVAALALCQGAMAATPADSGSPKATGGNAGFSFSIARDLPLMPAASLAVDAAGNTYLAGAIASRADVNLQTRPPPAPPVRVRGRGGGDVLLARYDPSGNIAWARSLGGGGSGAGGGHLTATGAAITRDRTLAFIGTVTGRATFGADELEGASPVAYVAAAAAGSGKGLWAKQADLGGYGSLSAIASNPASPLNRIAVCGRASVAARGLVARARHGGLADLVIAVFDSKGERLWSTQVGGKGTEGCNAVAVDDAGDVYAAGWFDGANLTFPGRKPLTVNGPGTALQKFLWVAKFAGAGNGSGGAEVLRAAAFGGRGGAALPNGLAVAPDGGLFVAGQFTGDLTIGAAMASAGQDDGFVAKLDGKTLAPAWNGVRLGGGGVDQVRGIAATSSGDAIATGWFEPSHAALRKKNGGKDTSGAAGLASAGLSDLFVLRIDGATGATKEARAYGDVDEQTGDAVAVNRFGGDQLALLGGVAGSARFGGAREVKATSGKEVVLVVGKAK